MPRISLRLYCFHVSGVIQGFIGGFFIISDILPCPPLFKSGRGSISPSSISLVSGGLLALIMAFLYWHRPEYFVSVFDNQDLASQLWPLVSGSLFSLLWGCRHDQAEEAGSPGFSLVRIMDIDSAACGF